MVFSANKRDHHCRAEQAAYFSWPLFHEHGGGPGQGPGTEVGQPTHVDLPVGFQERGRVEGKQVIFVWIGMALFSLSKRSSSLIRFDLSVPT